MTEPYMPAEWEHQSAIQLTWPHSGTDWNEYLAEINETYAEMAEAITRYEKLVVVSPDCGSVKKLLTQRLNKDRMERITFHECPTNDTWARDHGFITVKDKLDPKAKKLLDFQFNGWGCKFEASLDNKINQSLHAANIVDGEYSDNNNFVLEGGSIESDGKGTVLTTTCCLSAPNRNQPLTQIQIEAELKKRLYAQRIIWIDHGKLTGDDTDGHIDTLVRMAPDDTLIYVGCDNPQDEQYTELRLMEEQLETLRTIEGKPYRLLRLPMPEAMFYDQKRLPATYANFIVINNAVIYPTYNQPENDKEAEETLKQAFPGRELIGIDSSIIVRQHGSLHCCSMQLY